MSMLAERRRRTKWSLNPNGNAWSNDKSKFGQKMLEKMGWKEGSGLGAQLQGPKEHVRVTSKNDNKGLGFKGHDDTWLKIQEEYEKTLAELSAIHGGGTDDSDKRERRSLEEISKSSKARIHYAKFVRGKDVSRCSEKDLACIFGRPMKNSSQNETLPSYQINNDSESSLVSTVEELAVQLSKDTEESSRYGTSAGSSDDPGLKDQAKKWKKKWKIDSDNQININGSYEDVRGSSCENKQDNREQYPEPVNNEDSGFKDPEKKRQRKKRKRVADNRTESSILCGDASGSSCEIKQGNDSKQNKEPVNNEDSGIEDPENGRQKKRKNDSDNQIEISVSCEDVRSSKQDNNGEQFQESVIMGDSGVKDPEKNKRKKNRKIDPNIKTERNTVIKNVSDYTFESKQDDGSEKDTGRVLRQRKGKECQRNTSESETIVFSYSATGLKDLAKRNPDKKKKWSAYSGIESNASSESLSGSRSEDKQETSCGEDHKLIDNDSGWINLPRKKRKNKKNRASNQIARSASHEGVTDCSLENKSENREQGSRFDDDDSRLIDPAKKKQEKKTKRDPYNYMESSAPCEDSTCSISMNKSDNDSQQDKELIDYNNSGFIDSANVRKKKKKKDSDDPIESSISCKDSSGPTFESKTGNSSEYAGELIGNDGSGCIDIEKIKRKMIPSNKTELGVFCGNVSSSSSQNILDNVSEQETKSSQMRICVRCRRMEEDGTEVSKNIHEKREQDYVPIAEENNKACQTDLLSIDCKLPEANTKESSLSDILKTNRAFCIKPTVNQLDLDAFKGSNIANIKGYGNWLYTTALFNTARSVITPAPD